ncbi:MAG TPA: ATP-binding protein [Verrucomicrobiae bacterium]|jgi:signal transduction histidine kinase|nr:ATP-binding protein [Verrucomicrobiae bacterium]
MNYQNYIDLAAGALQLTVAGYALWLKRHFRAVHVGWWLFCAFASLAVLHWAESADVIPDFPRRNIILDGAYGITSILLLIGMYQIQAVLKWYQGAEQKAREAQAALEETLRIESEKLSIANDDLRETADRLRSEKLGTERSHKEMLEVSRKAGMSEVATSVLHNVGNVLNSVNVSAAVVSDHIAEFKIQNIGQVARLMREHANDLGNYLTNDPKGKQLPDYLAKLATHLGSEQTLILKEIGFVRTKIEHIKQIVTTQQSYGKVMGLAESVRMDDLVEDVLRIQAVEMAEHQVSVKRDYAPKMPEIVVDKHKVLQILLNLLSNAKHACVESEQAPKEVNIRVANGSGRIKVTVSDNGVGIPPANLKRIFNHGFTTKKSGGHGFGLHGSALAAKELGGSLEADSEGEGKGATFVLEIPVERGGSQSRL